MRFKVRQAIASDVEGIYNAHMSSIKNVCSQSYNAEQIEAWTSSPKPTSYADAMKDGEVMFVAVEDGEVIGFSGVKDDEIRAVYVSPQHLKKKVGSALLKAAQDVARRNGHQEAKLSSTLNAKDFYAAHGWAVQEESTHELRDGTKIPCIKMTRALT